MADTLPATEGDRSPAPGRSAAAASGNVGLLPAPPPLPPDAASGDGHEAELRGLRRRNQALREALHDLAVSGELYRERYEEAPVGYLTLARGAVALGGNEAACRLLGMSADELRGTHLTTLLGARAGQKLAAHCAEVLSSGRRVTCELQVWLGEGESRWLRLDSVVQRSGPHRGERVMTTLLDISEQRRLQRELLQQQKMEAMGRLASGVAHDFNNLLMGVCGVCDMALSASRRGADVSELLEAIKKAAVEGAGLAHQLTQFSRRKAVDPKPVEPDAIIAGMERILQSLLGAGIALRFHLAAPGAVVHCQPAQIEQIVMNLALNARDAMEGHGRLTIATQVVEGDPERPGQPVGLTPGQHLILSVTDTGCGMDAATQERIFEPFFTTKAPGEGTGLGLASVYGAVQQMQGRIKLASQVGRGSRFSLHLPCASDGGRSPWRRTPTEEIPLLAGDETVLVVDDEELVRLSVCHYLERWGYKVLDAASGEEALERLDAHDGPVHLLLCDVVLPGMAGDAVAAAVAERSPETRTLFMSAFHDRKLRREGRIPQDAEALQKPFSETALVEQVRRALRG